LDLQSNGSHHSQESYRRPLRRLNRNSEAPQNPVERLAQQRRNQVLALGGSSSSSGRHKRRGSGQDEDFKESSVDEEPSEDDVSMNSWDGQRREPQKFKMNTSNSRAYGFESPPDLA
jgi:hypothetical protein